MKSQKDCRAYWLNPGDENLPRTYLVAPERTEWLVRLVKQFMTHDSSILELGCNCARNLNGLANGGYCHLAGIDLNPEAITLARGLVPYAVFECGPVEDVLPTHPDREFDLIFTMAVLEHLPPESNDLFAHIERVAYRYVVTIEDEHSSTDRHYPRNYREVFKNLHEVFEAAAPGDLGSYFVARVFSKFAKV